MATTFLSAGDARTAARNLVLIWTEINEVEAAILATIDNNKYSTIVNGGTPFTTLQEIISVTVTNGGINYDKVVATASISTTNVITIQGQDETDFVGGAPNGTFVGGDGAGGTAYVAADTITLSDGTVIKVDSVNGAGDVITFDITSASTTPYTSGDTLTQTSSSGSGTGFTLTTGTNNEIIGTGATLEPIIASDGSVANFTITAPGKDYFGSPNDIVVTVTHPTGVGFTGIGQISDVGEGFVTKDTQTQADYTGGAPNGTFTAGQEYFVTEEITLTDGTIITVDTIADTGVVTIALQDETFFDNSPTTEGTFVGGDGTGSTAYVVEDTITLNDGTVITVDAVDVNGDVTEFMITSSSTDQFPPGATLVQVSTSGTGLGFTLTTDTDNEEPVGSVTAFTVTTGTSGTSTSEEERTQSSTTGIGTGFTLTPGTANEETTFIIVGVSIQEGGAQYDDLLPTAAVSDPTGVGATLLVNLADPADGTIASIDVVTGGFGYTNPTVTITPALTDDGSGATATATAEANTFGTTPSDYYDELVGQTSDRVIADQIQFVLDYFDGLGYNIRAQVNPATNNTIQWQLIW